MSWTCPVCQKTYEKTNQYHICETNTIETLFREDEKLIQIYEVLLERMKPWGDYNIRISKKSITLVTRAGFLLVYPRKESVELRFFLARIHEDHPVFKVMPRTKTKFVHYTRLYEEEDIDLFLLDLLKEAYDLSK